MTTLFETACLLILTTVIITAYAPAPTITTVPPATLPALLNLNDKPPSYSQPPSRLRR